MRHATLLIAIISIWGQAMTGSAQIPDYVTKELGSKPPASAQVLTDVDVKSLKLRDNSTGMGKATLTIVDADDGVPVSKAVRVSVPGKAKQPWDIAVETYTTKPVKRGDVLFGVCYARMIESDDESGEAQGVFNVGQAAAPYARIANANFRVGRKWEAVLLSGRAKADFDTRGIRVIAQLGHRRQVVEIAGLTVVNLGPDGRVPNERVNRVRYSGGGPDAKWRIEANERIEQLRKANIKLKVVDEKGQPISGAGVKVEMTRHAFPFGTCVKSELLGHGDGRVSDEDIAKYKQHILDNFNIVVFGNGLKWISRETDSFIRNVDKSFEWLEKNKLPVRGHTLVWPGWKKQNPRELPTLSPDALRKRINDHIRKEASAFSGRVVDWDVINEPRANKDFMKVLGDDEMIEWFKIAREADPHAKLYVNDFGILSGNNANVEKSLKITRFLIDGGAPLDGIGFQGHFGGALPKPERIYEVMNRFAEFGKDLAVTEFDINIKDEQTQAEFTRDFYTLAFSHPQMTSILMWGFWEGRHWRPDGAMIRKDWSWKPNGEAYRSLVYDEWRTDENLTTDESGEVELRGFLGDYKIIVSKDGKSQTIETRLMTGGLELDAKLTE